MDTGHGEADQHPNVTSFEPYRPELGRVGGAKESRGEPGANGLRGGVRGAVLLPKPLPPREPSDEPLNAGEL
jgi:hypothetical protein